MMLTKADFECLKEALQEADANGLIDLTQGQVRVLQRKLDAEIFRLLMRGKEGE